MTNTSNEVNSSTCYHTYCSRHTKVTVHIAERDKAMMSHDFRHLNLSVMHCNS